MSKPIKGIPGSKGYSIGTAQVKQSLPAPTKQNSTTPKAESQKLQNARAAYTTQLTTIINDPASSKIAGAVEILGAYQTIAGDDTFFDMAITRMESEQINIEYALFEECKAVVNQLEEAGDAYLRDRAADIENVCNEIIYIMQGIKRDFALSSKSNLTDIIVVASDLTPAETIKMDKTILRGFITEKGGPTSHTVILAKALGIPAITGAIGALDAVKDGDQLLLDAFDGEVTINPSNEQKEKFQIKQNAFNEKQREYAKNISKPAVTIDGHHINVNINAGDPDSIEAFNPETCDGIGLLRTEFLYMDRNDYPDEETQYQVYSALAKKAAGKEVIIRTLDIGGDKQIDYMNLPAEENPFLGCRAIRLCFERREVFQTQLRAILRASAAGNDGNNGNNRNVKIMFPMIVNVEELRMAKSCVEEAKESLRKDGIRFNENIPIGIMIETPAAAFISDRLAQESDFFSIGSNDLIGYITATDRMNERVSYLYDSANLAVLTAIKMVAESAAKAGIPWGICGEVASEDSLIPLWIALGVSELSTSPSMVGHIKHIIRQSNKAGLLPKVAEVLNVKTAGEVRNILGS